MSEPVRRWELIVALALFSFSAGFARGCSDTSPGRLAARIARLESTAAHCDCAGTGPDAAPTDGGAP